MAHGLPTDPVVQITDSVGNPIASAPGPLGGSALTFDVNALKLLEQILAKLEEINQAIQKQR